jgi:hypothetical protein
MTAKRQTILAIFTTVYLVTVLLTDISLTGYWTDIIFSILLVSIGLLTVFKSKSNKSWLNFLLRTSTIIYSIFVFGLVGLNLIDPFARDIFKMKSFYFENVNGRLFNANFKPVGAYARGEGVFWITESPKFLPIIEIEKYFDRAVLWDFKLTEWDGEPIDQNEVLKDYIQDKVIEKENKK